MFVLYVCVSIPTLEIGASVPFFWVSQVVLAVKNSSPDAGDTRDAGSIPWWERSPGERYGNALQYSCQDTPMDRGAWQALALGVAKSWTWLTTYHFSRFHMYALMYDICFSLSDLLHTVWQTLGTSISPNMTQFCSFLWLSNIAWCVCNTSLSVHLSLDI